MRADGKLAWRFAHILPGDIFLAQGLEDRGHAGHARHIAEPAGRLIGVIHHAARRARRGELAVRVSRSGMFGMLFLLSASQGRSWRDGTIHT
jgi:hypothetical protein